MNVFAFCLFGALDVVAETVVAVPDVKFDLEFVEAGSRVEVSLPLVEAEAASGTGGSTAAVGEIGLPLIVLGGALVAVELSTEVRPPIIVGITGVLSAVGVTIATEFARNFSNSVVPVVAAVPPEADVESTFGVIEMKNFLNADAPDIV